MHMVVYDVRQAIASVRTGLNLPALVWPQILLVNDQEGVVVMPANVDEFGKAILDENGRTT